MTDRELQEIAMAEWEARTQHPPLIMHPCIYDEDIRIEAIGAELRRQYIAKRHAERYPYRKSFGPGGVSSGLKCDG